MKKGFTLVELLAVIVVIAIVSMLAVVSVKSITESGKKGVYKNYEMTLKGSTEDYFIKNIEELPNVNSSKNISIETLVNNHFMDSIKDPKGGNCNSSYVVVTRGEDVSNNFNLSYKVCLICTNYKSEGC